MLTVCQRSALSGFHYQALDDSGTLLADIVWPTVAQAKNARLKWHPPDAPDADVQIRMSHALYRIGFEYLSRGFTNESRFTLHQGGEALAVAEVRSPKEWFKRQTVSLLRPYAVRLVRANRWMQTRYRLERSGRVIGVVEEPRRFSVKRELAVDLPADWDLPTQIFVAFLVINASYR